MNDKPIRSDRVIAESVVGTPSFDLIGPSEAEAERMAWGRYCFAEGVKHATSERDRYRELLEARIAGVEAMLTAVLQQHTMGDINPNLIKRIRNYLSGSGPA